GCYLRFPSNPNHPLILSSPQASVCNHLRPHDATFSRISLQLLRDMLCSQTRCPCLLHFGINNYFRYIQNFLLHNFYSACTWDHVCLYARACF
ncbi:interferon-like, partial [Phasianus colchicus]|uniref:interferon-like n=1 Tax=Phasianus colchicus TaxID=9054 RepID=UPI00129D24C6